MYSAYKANNMATQQAQQEMDGDLMEVMSICGPKKVVGIYFSAHWCPPCKAFTPKLAEFYNKLKEKNPDFEIVFASSDRDENAFNGYFGEMPWVALPYENRKLKEKLSKKYKVQGIPTLVIIDGQTGETITKNGRSEVVDDPEGKEFPWWPKTFTEIIPGKLVNKDGVETDAVEAIKGKFTGIYFSAHWCPPCKAFTPKLADTYKKLKSANKNFEVIFVTGDRDEKSFKEYLEEMPWLALPYEDSRISKLNKMFDVEGIPSLIIVDENGKIINENGRGRVSSDSDGLEFPWHPKPVNELTSDTAGKLNTDACLVLFTGDSDDDVKTTDAECLLEEIGKQECGKQKPDLFVFYAPENGDLTQRLCDFTSCDRKVNRLAIFNMADSKKYLCPESKITKEKIAKFVQDYIDNKIESANIQ